MAGNTDAFNYRNSLMSIINEFHYSARYPAEELKRKVDFIQQVLENSAKDGSVDLTKTMDAGAWAVPFYCLMDELAMPAKSNFKNLTATIIALLSFDGDRLQILYIDVRMSTTANRNVLLAETICDELKAKNLYQYLLAFVADANQVNLQTSKVSPTIPLLWHCKDLRVSLQDNYHSDIVYTNFLVTEVYLSTFLRNNESPEIEKWKRFARAKFNISASDIITKEIENLENVSKNFFAIEPKAPTFTANFANNNILKAMGQKLLFLLPKAIAALDIPKEYTTGKKGLEFLSYIVGVMALFEFEVPTP